MKKSTLTALTAALALGSVSSLSAASPWSHSLGLGLNIAKGNNETTLFNANYDAQKKLENSKTKFGASANSGEESNTQTTNNYGAYGQYNRNLTTKNYWYIGTSADIDKIADLDLRFTLGPGFGRNFLDTAKQELDVEAGLSYLSQKFKNSPKQDDLGVRVAETYKFKLSETAHIWQNAEYLGNTDEIEEYLLNAQIGLQAAVNSHLNLKTYIENKHNSRPAGYGTLGQKKRNDTSFVTMLVYNF